MDRRALQAQAERWRTLATALTADLHGKAHGRHYFKPTGIVKAKIQAQIATLISCATTLEELLDEKMAE